MMLKPRTIAEHHGYVKDTIDDCRRNRIIPGITFFQYLENLYYRSFPDRKKEVEAILGTLKERIELEEVQNLERAAAEEKRRAVRQQSGGEMSGVRVLQDAVNTLHTTYFDSVRGHETHPSHSSIGRRELDRRRRFHSI